MNGLPKITESHRTRTAAVYLRQSTYVQVRDNTESTLRQYDLAERAVELGWAREDVLVIDADLGRSAKFGTERLGFCDLVAQVCLGEVGAVFGLEVSRLARSSADFARLLEYRATAIGLMAKTRCLEARRQATRSPREVSIGLHAVTTTTPYVWWS